jgi:hypothetical protein
MDLDNACFIILIRDFPTIFGIIIQPTNRKVKVKNLLEFDD